MARRKHWEACGHDGHEKPSYPAMSHLLYIEASPRKQRSSSIEVSRHFLDVYRAAHPEDTVEVLDLWAKPLPPFDGFTIDAKYAVLHGQSFTLEQKAAWEAVVALANHFKSADKFLISLPMWNFGIPYILKHYLDLILQPGLTFGFDPAKGYFGLVNGKKAAVVYSRGGAYGTGTGAEGYDQQVRYLTQALGFVGLTAPENILVEPTLAGPEAKDAAVAKAKLDAGRVAAAF